ncbi:Lsr2 family protein [Spiractinospora alimapuensis]|uniref:histone-like nucleoid-structuring protein Lsr2 n=1 Tax=Spiractinospora alimapuensis TaxID=2820884 RepID=UPI001F2716E1|nr:Lsr2 family protein [Spiractinospora alimapuensis]QVQ50963.1 Lsr2 family protein [Spiractinospora alimapuensis]
MAQKVQVLLVDDLDGGEAEETVQFAVDGSAYEIDLSGKNAAKLRETLAPYVEVARKAQTSKGRRGRLQRSQPSRERSAEIRKWAKEHGKQVNERGRIPQSIVAEYEAAQR